jgi:nitrogen fixation protein FixH
MRTGRVQAPCAIESQYRFTGRQMLIITLAFFGVAAAANASLAYFANSSWPGLAVQNSYVASQQFNSRLAEARRQNALGWAFALEAGRDGLLLQARTAQGAPLQGLEVAAGVRRPTSEIEDRLLELAEREPGRYAVRRPLPAGVWEIELTATRNDGARVTRLFRLFVEPGAQP